MTEAEAVALGLAKLENWSQPTLVTCGRCGRLTLEERLPTVSYLPPNAPQYGWCCVPEENTNKALHRWRHV